MNRTCVLYGGRKEEKYLGDLILPKNKILGDWSRSSGLRTRKDC